MAAIKGEIISEALLEQTRSLISQGSREAVMELVERLRPADLADLIEHLTQEERLYIIQLLEPEGAGEVLMEIEPPVQERIVMDLDNKAISEIVEELDSDDAADLVKDLPKERAKEIISAVDEATARDLERLLPYDEDSAGGIMDLDVVAIRSHLTVQDAIEVIRRRKEAVENLYHVWVVDRSDRLVGVISIKDLVVQAPDRRISEIMNPEVLSVSVHADQEEVIRLARKYDLVNIPVVDDNRRLVGRITYDDILDVIEEEADEDIAFMAGVIDQEITEEAPLKVSRARLPWLIAGLFGGLLAALVISRFESSLEKVLALSFFFPVIMAMGGNTGTQASTVVVRGLATGEISVLVTGRRLWLEMKVALLNGLVCGVLLGVIVGIWLSDYALGCVVALSLVLIVVNSGIIGSAVPLTLKKFGIDPALATGPFVTTSNDILGLLIYLGLVSLFFRFLT